jgi:hypothetical protein
MLAVMVLTVAVLKTMVIMGGDHCGEGDDNDCSDMKMDAVIVMITVVVM